MSRSAQLLKAAADALERGEDPLHFSFLSEHDVESGECLDLADSLALGARLIAWAMENPLKAAAFARNGSAGIALDEITRAMSKIKIGA
jgi:hypothetical protein